MNLENNNHSLPSAQELIDHQAMRHVFNRGQISYISRDAGAGEP